MKPGGPREGAHTGRMMLEMEIALDLEGKHELGVFAGFIFSMRSRKNYNDNLIRIGRVVSLCMNYHS